MKKIILIFINIMFCFNLINVKAEENVDITPNGPEILAESAVLIDAKSGKILYQKYANSRMYPASITKILTVYLACLNLNPETVLTASDSAIFGFDRNSSHLWIDVNEEVKAIDLEYASLLSSANDATNILAEGVSGSQEAFVELMNQTVADMGLENTHFNNAHGLPDENHYSSAYDMALITRMAIKNTDFLNIFSSKSYKMAPTNKQSEARQLANGNEMIKNSKNYYEYAIGGKIGWTEDAGYTMVTYASKNNMDLIAVVMKESESENRYIDTKALFDYGFNNYKTLLIKGSDIESKTVEIKKGSDLWAKATFFADVDFNILLPYNADEGLVSTEIEIRNDDNPDDIAGYVVIKIDGEVVGEQLMNKSIEVYDISFKATKFPIIEKTLDYISIAVLGLFLLRHFVLSLRKIKLPE